MGLSLEKIDLIIYDFDGVMTDGRFLMSLDGTESVFLHRSDGLAISKLSNAGITQIILTGEINPIVRLRGIKLGIPVIHSKNKRYDGIAFCAGHDIALSRVCFVGNDVNDIGLLQEVGYPVCPSDAYPEVQQVCVEVLQTPGGHGVVRELYGKLCDGK